MLQRIQTVFLLLATACLVTLFFIPFATSTQAIGEILSDRVFDLYDYSLLKFLIGFDVLFTFFLIFLYRNRKLQIRLSYLSIIVDLAITILPLWLYFNEVPASSSQTEISHSFGFYLPPISIIFIALALYYIRKDEQLVRSMDRLR